MVDLAWIPHRGRQIGWPDEDNVNARDGERLFKVVHRLHGLHVDCHHSLMVCLPNVIGQGTREPVIGCSHCSKAPPPLWPILDRLHDALSIGFGVDHWHLDAQGAYIQIAKDVLLEIHCHADDGRDIHGIGCPDHMFAALYSHRAMLGIEDGKIEPDMADYLYYGRTPHRDENAIRRLARLDSLLGQISSHISSCESKVQVIR